MFTHIPIGFAVIGFALAAGFAGRAFPQERNAPPVAGVIGAVVFYLAFPVLLVAITVAMVALGLCLALRAWPTVHETITTYARERGLLARETGGRTSFSDRLAALREEHRARRSAILDLDLAEDEREEVLEMADGRFADTVKELTQERFS